MRALRGRDRDKEAKLMRRAIFVRNKVLGMDMVFPNRRANLNGW